jgi:hypothetical protein
MWTPAGYQISDLRQIFIIRSRLRWMLKSISSTVPSRSMPFCRLKVPKGLPAMSADLICKISSEVQGEVPTPGSEYLDHCLRISAKRAVRAYHGDGIHTRLNASFWMGSQMYARKQTISSSECCWDLMILGGYTPSCQFLRERRPCKLTITAVTG